MKLHVPKATGISPSGADGSGYTVILQQGATTDPDLNLYTNWTQAHTAARAIADAVGYAKILIVEPISGPTIINAGTFDMADIELAGPPESAVPVSVTFDVVVNFTFSGANEFKISGALSIDNSGNALNVIMESTANFLLTLSGGVTLAQATGASFWNIPSGFTQILGMKESNLNNAGYEPIDTTGNLFINAFGSIIQGNTFRGTGFNLLNNIGTDTEISTTHTNASFFLNSTAKTSNAVATFSVENTVFARKVLSGNNVLQMIEGFTDGATFVYPISVATSGNTPNDPPEHGIDLVGSLGALLENKNGNMTVDSFAWAPTTTAGDTTITLPQISSANNRIHIVYKRDAANKITVSSAGTDTFMDGSTSIELHRQGEFLLLHAADFTSPDTWHILRGSMYGDDRRFTDVNSATYSVVESDRHLQVRRTATGACAITLPAITSILDGKEVTIKDSGYNASSNTITVNTTGGDTINNVASPGTMTTDGASWILRANNTTSDWELI